MDDLIGKGLDFTIFAKYYWYVSLSLVPMSLPLAILLASLMTFGNFGEKLELLAMKAAGISLFHIMRPLIVFIIFISAGAYFFQDHIMPVAQLKLVTLTASFKQKPPEVAIPEGSFYSDISGITLHVDEKDKETGELKGIMIYDFSQGYNNTSVTIAKRGFLKSTKDKKHIILTLYDGESFSNFKKQQVTSGNIPYRREKFAKEEYIRDFDANLNMLNESNFENLHFSKNSKELIQAIDSLRPILDSIKGARKTLYTESKYLGRDKIKSRILAGPDSIEKATNIKPEIPDIDSIFYAQDKEEMLKTAIRAKRDIKDIKNDIVYKKMTNHKRTYQYRRSGIELQRKFTLSFACLVFFFIGAPLGSIIRKGGFGTSAVVSVILFIIYYMIDNSGYKLAKSGAWTPVEGTWLSSMVLLPLGLFLTYKAVKDSVILNSDVYMIFIKKINLKSRIKKILKHINNGKRVKHNRRSD